MKISKIRARDIVIVILLLVIVSLLLTFIIEARNQNIKQKATFDLLLFSGKVSQYCAISNNMTYQALLDDYVRNKTEELINDN